MFKTIIAIIILFKLIKHYQLLLAIALALLIVLLILLKVLVALVPITKGRKN